MESVPFAFAALMVTMDNLPLILAGAIVVVLIAMACYTVWENRK